MNRWLLLVVGVLVFSICSLGQTQPNLENGYKPYGSYDGGKIDTVNLMNGNLLLDIPAPFHNPQRGKLDPQYSFYLTSKNWTVQCAQQSQDLGGGISCQWTPGVPANCVLPATTLSPAGQVCAFPTGVGLTSSLNLTVKRTLETELTGVGTTTHDALGYSLVTADLAVHGLYAIPGTQDPTGHTTQFQTMDGSGFHVQLSTPDGNGIMQAVAVTDRAGNQYSGTFPDSNSAMIVFRDPFDGVLPDSMPNGTYAPLANGSGGGTSTDYFFGQLATISTVTDPNGNVFNLSTGKDTLGNTPPVPPVSSDTTDCVSPLPIASVQLYSYYGTNGSVNQIKFCYSTFPIQTNFSQASVAQSQASPAQGLYKTTSMILVATIVLPDHSKWIFNYDGYGEVNYVGLPLGGSITYGWTEIGFPNCTGVDETRVSRAVSMRTVTDNNSNSFTWHYNWGTQNGSTITNVVTDPAGNDIVHVFTGGCDAVETTTQYYQGSSASNKLLKEIDTVYSSAAVPDDTNSGRLGNIFATDITTTIYPSGKVSKVHREPDPGLGTGKPIFGNVVKEQQYDWGQGGPGPLLRETDNVYQWQKTGTYFTANMLDLPASSVVIDPVATNNTKTNCPVTLTTTTACIAETDYTYDESAYLTGYQATIGALPVGTQAAPPNAVRGNLTTVSNWLNTGSAVLSHTNWYDTGEVFKQIDPLGHTTTHSYDLAYAGAYSTKTCSPSTGSVAHCVSGTYDLTTGLLTSFTNENAAAHASGNAPGDSAHTTTYVYDLMWRMTSATFPPDPSNNNLPAVTQITYPVPIALPFVVQKHKSITTALSDVSSAAFDGLGRAVHSYHTTPAGIGTVDTTYDALGHVASVSNPYFTTGDLTFGITQTIYDALDRPLLTQKPDGSFSTVIYQDNCTLAEDEAGKARRTCVDGLGRLSAVEEPGDMSAPAATDTSTVSTQAKAVVSISGGEQVLPPPPPPKCPKPPLPCDQTPSDPVYDEGTVSITANGHTTSASYGQGDTASSAALNLANAINLDGAAVVSASAAGTQITLTARTAGESGDYTVSFSTTWDTADFTRASFSGLVSNFRLLGGADLNQFAHTYLTQYQYDALGNLLCVEQHGNVAPGTPGATGCSAAPSSDATSPWRVRRFTYDSLGRLLTAKNPESGTITYSYDLDGNLLQKTSPAPNQPVGSTATQTISYCYDELHRVTGRAYSAQSCPLTSPVVSYTYDVGANAKGKLTSLTDQAGTATYSYDPLGRLTGETRVISGISKSLSYTYNLDGSMKSLTYPSGRVVSYTPDSAGRLVSAVDSNGTNYVTSATYNAANSLTSVVNGNSATFAGISSSFLYNPRLQLCRITAFSSGSVPNSCIDPANHGNLMDRGYNYNLNSGDNGNVMGITNYRDTTRSQSFTYDALNRLTSGWSAANTGALSWGETYSIDAWGNLQISPISGKAHGGNFQRAGDGNNRAAGLGYDAAGNLTNYTAPGQYRYDAENRLASAASMSYTYDEDGERVLKSDGNTGAPVKCYWSSGGNVLAESDGPGSITAEYIYFGGGRVARIDLPGNSVHYYLSDHLGSTSVVASATGVIEEESDYYPFGTEVVVTAGGNHYKFTGKEWDSETGLDYFNARYYFNGLGRFTTSDDESDQNAGDPQSWNLYSYVRNNPVNRTDPTGRDCVVQTRTSDKTESVSVSAGTCAGVSVGDGQSATYVPGTVTGFKAGADGHSIDVGWDPYDGGPHVLQNINAAPVPDRPGLAYGYNAAGYRTLAQASMTVDRIAIATGVLSGANLAMMAASTGGITTLGLEGAEAESTLTGQMHHGISRAIHRALERHPNLRNVYKVRDSRFATQAKDLASHNGYQTWHRMVDQQVVRWIESNPGATPAQFESFLNNLYKTADLISRFPKGF